MNNTTKKGDEFERRIYTILENLIRSDRFITSSSLSTIYWKKKYFSRDRNANVVVDIAIECRMPGAKEPSLYIIVECKDYKHAIPVDDIEEFDSKISQISGRNVKAIFATTSNLQQSALSFAKSRKIAVVRVFNDNDDLDWVNYRNSNSLRTSAGNVLFINNFLALTEEIALHKAEICGCVDDEEYYHTWSTLLIALMNA